MLNNEQRRILSDDDIEIIEKEYWSKLIDPVEIIYINSNSEDPTCQYCTLIKELYNEITNRSSKLVLKEIMFENDPEISAKYNVDTPPVTILIGKNKGAIKYYGIPAGQEFPSFLEAIVMISTGKHELSNKLTEEIMKIDKPVNIKTFVTPSCPYCPVMVFTSYQFAMINEYIESEGWEVTEFPTVSARYDITAVPKIVVNDEVEWEGLVPPEYLLERIKEAL